VVVTTESDRRGALEALERIINRGGDADDVLRSALAILGRLYPYAAVRFVERGELVAGPSVGAQTDPRAAQVAEIRFQGMKVGELEAAAGEDDTAFLERFGLLLSPYCLVGWDTGGEQWTP
jgi:hypothetical protein